VYYCWYTQEKSFVKVRSCVLGYNNGLRVGIPTFCRHEYYITTVSRYFTTLVIYISKLLKSVLKQNFVEVNEFQYKLVIQNNDY